MLPVPASPAAAPAGLSRLLAGVILALALLLCGCTGAGQPPRAVLLDALGVQIQLTQGAIAEALALAPAGTPELNRVRVERQQAVRIGEARGLRLAGRFDWRLPGDPIRVDSPFELYLQRGEQGQSWRLALPSGSRDGATQEWLTYPLSLPGAAPG